MLFQLFKFLTRIWLPGFKRVYCADPKLEFLQVDVLRLQIRALMNGVQLICYNHREREEGLRRAEISLAAQSGSVAEPPSHMLRFIEYSVAVESEVRLHEVSQVIEADNGSHAAYAKRARAALRLVEKDIMRFKPHLLLLVQGHGVDAITARCCAVTEGIPMLALENTAMKDKVVWEPISGVTVNRNIARSVYLRYMDFVSNEEANEFCKAVVATTKQNKQDEHASPDRKWMKATDRPVVLYLGQVYTDSSLLYGCYDGLYPEDVVRALAVYCEANDAELVLKLHPKEVSGVDPVAYRSYDKLTMRKLLQEFEGDDTLAQPWVSVDSENQWDTYNLIESADVVVTINSQAGLEAAVRGKNVITSGRCFYSGLDFTTDVTSKDAFHWAIENALQTGYSKTKHRLAQKFFYIFFERYCVTRTTTEIVKLIKRATSYRF